MSEPKDKRILVVDDEEDVAFFLKTALEDAGFQVETAASVDEALVRIKAAAPDCISLDMMMPGKSGIVLYHELHKNHEWRDIPVLFVTGHAKDEKVKKDLDAASVLAQSTLSGPACYLEKPVTAEKYIAAVAAAVKVELAIGNQQSSSEEMLRSEVMERLKSAGAATLEEALKLLDKKS